MWIIFLLPNCWYVSNYGIIKIVGLMSREKINTFITENILLYDAYTITLHGKCYFGCENGTLKMCTKLLFWYGMDVKMPTTGCNQNCFQFGNARYQQTQYWQNATIFSVWNWPFSLKGTYDVIMSRTNRLLMIKPCKSQWLCSKTRTARYAIRVPGTMHCQM